ncbi:hypothetical protein [Alcanivorax sp.]|uniref:hypothetical protein n=1 Tax=Alcanivorax sp. TaxID=1872427 RepID=UPI00258EAF19|nr:hypothetical protein [Alcanivorax sp.]
MEMLEVFKALVLFGGVAIFSICIAVATRILTSDKSSYEYNRSRNSKVANALLGRVPTFHEGRRTHHVKAGLAVNTKTNEWVEQGTLSDEAIDSVLR